MLLLLLRQMWERAKRMAEMKRLLAQRILQGTRVLSETSNLKGISSE